MSLGARNPPPESSRLRYLATINGRCRERHRTGATTDQANMGDRIDPITSERRSASRCCQGADSRTASRLRTGTDAATVVLQLLAPKCAICWTTYAGLINAGWLTVSTAKPDWLVLSVISWLAAMSISAYDAWRTRRIWPVLVAAAAWLLLTAGWLANEPALRYTGITVLLARAAMIYTRSRCLRRTLLADRSA